MKHLVFIVGAFICFQYAAAQGIETEAPLGSLPKADSAKPEVKRNFFYKPKLVIGLGGHNSLTAFGKVRIGGIRGGV